MTALGERPLTLAAAFGLLVWGSEATRGDEPRAARIGPPRGDARAASPAPVGCLAEPPPSSNSTSGGIRRTIRNSRDRRKSSNCDQRYNMRKKINRNHRTSNCHNNNKHTNRIKHHIRHCALKARSGVIEGTAASI